MWLWVSLCWHNMQVSCAFDTFSFIVPPQTLARGHCIPLWLKCASNLLYWSFFHAVLLIAESDHSDWYWRYCMYSGSTYAWTNCFLLLDSWAAVQPIILLVFWNSRKKYHNLYAAGHTPISFLWLPFTITSICLLQVLCIVYRSIISCCFSKLVIL